jgi:hypothetical protein
MSNHASSWRRSVWQQFPFNEEMAACEDKEWMWRVLGAGHGLVVDPRILVDVNHRWDEGAKVLYRRVFKENAALAELVDFDLPRLGAAVAQWWAAQYTSTRPAWQRRLSPRRNAELAGEFLGARAGARKRGANTLAPSAWRQVLSPSMSSDRPE